ncbi:MAG: hypothetical protein IJ737_05530 [Ruminococcus sp.]|nr:hypothetical protein [Ruminococcus sp.]
MKKLIIAAAVLSMMLSAAGCGGKSKDTSSKKKSDTSSVITTEESSDESGTKEPEEEKEPEIDLHPTNNNYEQKDVDRMVYVHGFSDDDWDFTRTSKFDEVLVYKGKDIKGAKNKGAVYIYARYDEKLSGFVDLEEMIFDELGIDGETFADDSEWLQENRKINGCSAMRLIGKWQVGRNDIYDAQLYVIKNGYTPSGSDYNYIAVLVVCEPKDSEKFFDFAFDNVVSTIDFAANNNGNDFD